MKPAEITELENAIRAQELSEILQFHSARINTELNNLQLSPTILYCRKTGQPVGSLDNRTLTQSLAVHGREVLETILFYSNTSAVHPAWVKTGSNEHYNEALDKLCEADPRSYAVYCFNLATKPAPKKQDQREEFARHHWALARAWQFLSILSHNDLSELCDAMCHLLIYAPRSLHYLEKLISNERMQPDTLAREACSPTFLKTIERAIAATINWRDNFDAALKRKLIDTNLHDVALAELMRGPSQIRATRLAHKHSTNDDLRKKRIAANVHSVKQSEQEKEIALGVGAFLSKRNVIPGQETWRSRINRPQPAQEIVEDLGNINLDEIFTESDAKENEVEISTISWAELKKREDAADQEKLLASRETVPLSERLKIARAAKTVTIVETPKPKLPAHILARLNKGK